MQRHLTKPDRIETVYGPAQHASGITDTSAKDFTSIQQFVPGRKLQQVTIKHVSLLIGTEV